MNMVLTREEIDTMTHYTNNDIGIVSSEGITYLAWLSSLFFVQIDRLPSLNNVTSSITSIPKLHLSCYISERSPHPGRSTSSYGSRPSSAFEAPTQSPQSTSLGHSSSSYGNWPSLASRAPASIPNGELDAPYEPWVST